MKHPGIIIAFSLAAAGASSGGCSDFQSSLSPYVEIDSSFTILEQGIIISALSAWEDSTPSVSFPNVRIVDPAQIKKDWSDNPFTPTAFIFRSQVDACPMKYQGTLEAGTVAFTTQKERGDNNSFVCVDSMVENGLSLAVWRETITHELGHVLGLHHLPAPPPGGGALMFWQYGIHSAERPTCLDLQELQQVHPEAVVPENCITWKNVE
jgi:hypothetical protein